MIQTQPDPVVINWQPDEKTGIVVGGRFNGCPLKITDYNGLQIFTECGWQTLATSSKGEEKAALQDLNDQIETLFFIK